MKVRNRIFLVFVLCISLGMFVFSRWISDDLKFRYNESIEEPLVDISHVMAETIGRPFIEGEISVAELQSMFSRAYEREFSARIFNLDKHDVDIQIYITDGQGTVLFDSLDKNNIGKDFSNWNDIARTLNGEYGARSSPIKGNHKSAENLPTIAFVAAPIMRDETIIGVISVGKPKANVKRFLNMARSNQVFAALIIALSTLIVGFVVYRWVSRPLDKLVYFANQVRLGKRIDAPKLGDNEIGDVGRAVQSMREELEGKEYSERYVQTLTHELKSPLSAIRGAAELLSENVPPEQRKRFYTNIRTEALRVEDLVERLLQLAGIEKRQSLDQIETIKLRSLFEEILENYQIDINRKNLKIHLKNKTEIIIHAERFLIRQAIANLLQNAIDFSPEGGDIEIIVSRTDQWTEIIILDQGPGVPEYAKDKIFHRFYSLPRPSNGHKSTGLGLNFVKEIAELHNGRIFVDQENGKTKATLRLPT